MPIRIIILYHIHLDEFKEFSISANFKHFYLNWVELIHFKAAHETDLYAVTPMES